MAPVGTPAFSPVVGLPGSRSALLTTAAYADAQKRVASSSGERRASTLAHGPRGFRAARAASR